MVPHPRSWFDAWVESAYDPDGFWSGQRPRDHFRTASSTGDALARTIAALLDRRPEIGSVVDVGAGTGELLRGLHRLRPDLGLTGIDLRARPADLPARISWVSDLWDARRHAWAHGPAADLLARAAVPTLVVAAEWLDDLPCRVAAYDAGGWTELDVDPGGRELPGGLLPSPERQWAQDWWPGGPRAEIGLTRDRAWAHLVASARACGGSALLIDYGHELGGRPARGSLTGYRTGRQVPPAPTGEVNLTAHVALDAVRHAGEQVGAWTWLDRTQAEVFAELRPAEEPRDPVTDLVRRSHRAALAAPGVWGSQRWLGQA